MGLVDRFLCRFQRIKVSVDLGSLCVCRWNSAFNDGNELTFKHTHRIADNSKTKGRTGASQPMGQAKQDFGNLIIPLAVVEPLPDSFDFADFIRKLLGKFLIQGI